MTHYIITVEEDPETKDLLLPLPEEVLTELQLVEGDLLLWEDAGNGSFILRKKLKTLEGE
jgi:hypothetical protein